MSFHFQEKLPIPAETKKRYPVSEEMARKKAERDGEIRDVFTGKSDKFILVIGPCSADNEPAMLDYAGRLAAVQEEVTDRLILVPRVYTNKPRTTGLGYKGLLHQPDPEKESDLFAGVLAIRKLHMHVLEQTGLPTADEMLYPENYWYLSDVLSYVAVGARSVEDQQHRLTCSGMDIPAGMKNPTGGDLSIMMNAVIAAQAPQSFIYRGWAVNTDGNELAHTVLRGATDSNGNTIPNYHYEDLAGVAELYAHAELKNPACIVDTNHANSGKRFKEQIRIAKEVMHSRRHNGDIRALVKGLMIESYLVEGNQKIGQHTYGCSITDPCLGWEDSRRLICEIAEQV